MDDSPVVMEDQAPECHGAHRQNDSVPLTANVSTSRCGTCVSEQDVQLAATARRAVPWAGSHLIG
jgi:hypothetical protein